MPSPDPAILPPEFHLLSSTQIASLWSNYGHIYRLYLASPPTTLILKSIHPPSLDHSSESNVRKLLSYEIERWFYRHLATRLPCSVKVARSYPLHSDQEHNLLLEDLSAGYPFPARGSLGKEGTLCVLKWLAGFHRTYFGVHRTQDRDQLPIIPPPSLWKDGNNTQGVWERGTYWYLDTRREELEETDEAGYNWLLPWVQKVDNAIGKEIETYGTLLHGDVKGANIVFSRDPYNHRRGGKATTPGPLTCALYDLQYVGLGLPTHDLIYFLGTSVESSLLTATSEKGLLRTYLGYFHEHSEASEVDYEFEVLWRHWELAIVDWYRFMAGWGFWGNDRWVERRAREIIQERVDILV